MLQQTDGYITVVTEEASHYNDPIYFLMIYAEWHKLPANLPTLSSTTDVASTIPVREHL
jgi:hypothetical protein